FLSSSESQGLALLEAWMANVPTLVWNVGEVGVKGYKIKDDKLAAPYLSQSSGIFFKGHADFSEKLEFFLNNITNFQPRKYAMENFTDKIAAEKFLNIVNSI